MPAKKTPAKRQPISVKMALVASEQLGRPWSGSEISPAYCDVIVNRWETMTGRKAERAEG